MPPAYWYTGIVINIQDLAPKVKSYTLEIPEVKHFDFKPGQFITFDLPVSDKRINRWRSYSIASPPNDSNTIELCIVQFDGGLGSSYFFNEISLGSALKFKGPDGGFVLPDRLDHDVIMICTGTGLAPFRSMLLDLLLHPKPHRNIHLIFGTRTREDILYHQELKDLELKLAGFTFDFALSREKFIPKQDYNIHSGYVHPIYQKRYALYTPDIHFYLCGWSKMIDEAIVNLFVEMKYPRDQIHYELYG